MKKLPKNNLLLIGHTKNYDVYDDFAGNVYHYYGHSTDNFHNPKFWIQVNRGRRKMRSVS